MRHPTPAQLVGFVMLLSVGIATSARTYLARYPSIPSAKTSEQTVSQGYLSGKTTAAQYTAYYTNAIRLRLHAAMNVDQSSNISVELDRSCKLVNSDPTQVSDLPCPATINKGENVTLIASAFEIAPHAQAVIEKELEPPQQFVWNITPKRTGQFEIAIDLRDVLFKPQQDIARLTSSLEVDGQAAPFPADGLLRAEIVVNNAYGFDERLANAITWLLGGVGAFLAFPVIQNWLGTASVRRKNTPAP
jgi:hypothetical protein